jgi:competence protein ComEA
MEQRSTASHGRSFFSLFLAGLLLLLPIASLSCAKLPRQFQHINGQTAPPVSQQGTAPQTPIININTASAEELEKLPGIGKGLSQRIIAYREEYGRFRRPEHLLMVRGISTRRFRAMQQLITVE